MISPLWVTRIAIYGLRFVVCPMVIDSAGSVLAVSKGSQTLERELALLMPLVDSPRVSLSNGWGIFRETFSLWRPWGRRILKRRPTTTRLALAIIMVLSGAVCGLLILMHEQLRY